MKKIAYKLRAVSCTINKVCKVTGKDSYLVWYLPDDCNYGEQHVETMANMNVNRDLERVEPGTKVVLGLRKDAHWNNHRIVAMDGITRLPL